MRIFFKDLKTSPTDEKIKKMIKIDVIAIILVYIFMSIFFYISNTPLENLFLGQVCFNGEFIKLNVFTSKEITKPFNVLYYTYAQVLDYLFMICYAIGLFGITVMNSRKVKNKNEKKKSRLMQIGFTFAEFPIIAAFMDAFENMFVFLMLMNITGFPDAYAIGQSIFAVIKWILLISVVIINLVILIKRKIKEK